MHGIFYNLHLINVKGSDTTLHESIVWNTKFPDFKFEKCRHGPANGKRTYKLILSACSQVRLRNFMPTEKEKDILSNLRECYINRYINKVSPVTTSTVEARHATVKLLSLIYGRLDERALRVGEPISSCARSQAFYSSIVCTSTL